MTLQDQDTLDLSVDGDESAGHGNESLVKKIHRRLAGTYRYVVPLGLVLGAVGAVAAYKSVSNKYESAGVIQLAPTSQRVLYKTELSEEMPMFDAWVNAQLGQIMSPRVIDLALKNKHWVERGEATSRGEFLENLNVARAPRSLLISVKYAAKSPAVAQAAVQSVIESYQEVYLDKSNRGQVTTVESLQGVISDLNLQSKDMRNRIAEIAGPLSPSAMKDLYDAKFAEQVELEGLLTTSKLELAALEAQAIEQDTEADKRRPEGVDGDAQAVSPEEQDGPPVRTAREFAELDEDMATLVADRDSQTAILEQVISDYGNNHREAKKLRQAILTLDRRIQNRTDELNGLVAKRWAEEGDTSLGVDPNTPSVTIKSLKTRINSLTELRDEVKQQAESLNFDITRIQEILDDQEILNRRIREAEQRLASLQIERKNQGRLSVINEGELPKDPSNRAKRLQVSALAGLFGLGLPFSAVFLMGTLRGRIDRFDDAKATYGRDAFLGILPKLPNNLADPQQALVASLSVHEIRSMLHCKNGGQDAHVYMFTSPISGAGKTTLTLALGLSYAGTGSRTLLIDFDTVGAGLSSRVRRIVRSRLGKLLVSQGLIEEHQLDEAVQIADRDKRMLGEVLVGLGHISEPQLSEALDTQANQNQGLREAIDTEDIQSCITETGVENLYVLPVGETHVGDVGTFSPKHIRNLLRAAREHFDIVLIDTGPILGSLESSMLAREVDATVLIVAAGDQERMVNMAIERLDQSHANLAGLIFNRAKDADVVRFSSSASQRSRMNTKLEDPSDPSNGIEVTDEYGPVARATAAYMPRREPSHHVGE